MDLRNKLTHMHGMSVNVNGTRYAILPDGVARDIKDDDAKKLLQNDAWSIYTQRQPVAGQTIPAPAPEPPKKSEEPVPPAKPEVAPEPKKAFVGAPEALEEALEDPEEEDAEEDESEWPDPDEEMDIKYLREMADAYEVKYTIRSAKATLIKHIMAAMYPDGK